jgi:predicted esterase
MAALAIRSLNIATRIHGRVLVRDVTDPVAVVAGFHGYMENAEIQMARLEALPDAERAALVSVQGLNRFYRGRSEEVIAGWMTRQDREVMIADNVEYCDRAIASCSPAEIPLFTLGFSQGVAMAFRAAVRGRRRASGVVAVGGDVPPELLEDATVAFPAVLLARGERDDWYTNAKLDADADALRARRVPVETLVYPGAHEWTVAVAAAAARFIGLLVTP